MTKRELDRAAKAAYERARLLAKRDGLVIDPWEDLTEAQRDYWCDLQRSAFDELHL